MKHERDWSPSCKGRYSTHRSTVAVSQLLKRTLPSPASHVVFCKLRYWLTRMVWLAAAGLLRGLEGSAWLLMHGLRSCNRLLERLWHSLEAAICGLLTAHAFVLLSALMLWPSVRMHCVLMGVLNRSRELAKRGQARSATPYICMLKRAQCIGGSMHSCGTTRASGRVSGGASCSRRVRPLRLHCCLLVPFNATQRRRLAKSLAVPCNLAACDKLDIETACSAAFMYQFRARMRQTRNTDAGFQSFNHRHRRSSQTLVRLAWPPSFPSSDCLP